MIVEERIYRIRNGRMGRYLQLVREEGLAIQQPILGGRDQVLAIVTDRTRALRFPLKWASHDDSP